MKNLRLPEDASAFTLSPTPAEPTLPGMAEWKARQKQKAARELMLRELATLQPGSPTNTNGDRT